MSKRLLNKISLVTLTLADLRAAEACDRGIQWFKNNLEKNKKTLTLKWSPLSEIQYRTNPETKNFITWAIAYRLLPGNSYNAANLRKNDLSHGDFQHTDFDQAILSRANLSNSDFSFVKMKDACLKYANLENTDFSGANLCGADLSKAKINDYTDFSYAKINLATKFPKGFNFNGYRMIDTSREVYATNKIE